MLVLLLCIAAFTLLLFVNLPWLHAWFPQIAALKGFPPAFLVRRAILRQKVLSATMNCSLFSCLRGASC